MGRITGADQHDLQLADDVGDLLAAADRSYATFIEAADLYADSAPASCKSAIVKHRHHLLA